MQTIVGFKEPGCIAHAGASAKVKVITPVAAREMAVMIAELLTRPVLLLFTVPVPLAAVRAYVI
jgi:hypothetical protein